MTCNYIYTTHDLVLWRDCRWEKCTLLQLQLPILHTPKNQSPACQLSNSSMSRQDCNHDSTGKSKRWWSIYTHFTMGKIGSKCYRFVIHLISARPKGFFLFRPKPKQAEIAMFLFCRNRYRNRKWFSVSAETDTETETTVFSLSIL